MKFVKNVMKLYNLLSEEAVKNKSNILDDYLSLINTKLYYGEIKSSYRDDMHNIIKSKLSFCSDKTDFVENLNELNFYKDSMAIYTTIIIFWAKYNKVEIEESDFSKLAEATFIGVIGYKLIDLHTDENELGPEGIIIGNYLIHLYEELLAQIFHRQNIFPVIGKYKKMYTEAEFFEKVERWNTCPFTWEEPEKIGWKAAPLFSIFELLFKNAGLNEKIISNNINGLIYASAALQMADDFMDAVKDLSNGTESLIVKGYYEHYPNDKIITPAKVSEFLDDERVLKFYDVTQTFYTKAGKVFEDDIILNLFLQLQHYRFNKSIAE